MEPFATIAQLEASWRTLDADETALATNKLARASRMIRALKSDIDALILDGSIDPAMVADVVCEMVRRSMVAPAGGEGVSTGQFTAGPFSQSQTFSNPDAAVYLSKLERKMLGIGRGQAFMIDLLADA